MAKFWMDVDHNRGRCPNCFLYARWTCPHYEFCPYCGVKLRLPNDKKESRRGKTNEESVASVVEKMKDVAVFNRGKDEKNTNTRK